MIVFSMAVAKDQGFGLNVTAQMEAHKSLGMQHIW
jgi:hypothetical protein